MNIKEKKADIIKIINQASDEGLINEVYALVHNESEIEAFEINNFPSEIQTKLLKAIEDYKTGNYISHEQMKQKIQSWSMK